jgi:hypothetical protein
MKKSINYVFPLGIIVCIVLQGCAAYSYFPNTVQTPMLEKKGELQITPQLNGEISADYAISKNFFITADGSSKTGGGFNGYKVYNYNLYEAGAGYYCARKGGLRFGGFGNFGIGSSKILPMDSNGWYNVSSKYTRISGTIYYGVVSKVIDVSIANRFSYVMFYRNNFSWGINPYDQTQYYTVQDDYILDNRLRNALFMEPALNVSLGYKNVKIYGELGASISLNRPKGYMAGPKNTGYDPYYPAIICLGLNIKLFTGKNFWKLPE